MTMSEDRETKLKRRHSTKDNSRKKKAQAEGPGGGSRAKPKVAPGRKKTKFGPVMPKKMALLIQTRKQRHDEVKKYLKSAGRVTAMNHWIYVLPDLIGCSPGGFGTIGEMLEAIEYETSLLHDELSRMVPDGQA